ncbi:MAG: lipoprotein-releasing ABC transporter ATP-binding protein LolD [Francisellaceae bacterium]
MSNSNWVLHCENLSKSYQEGRRTIAVLKDISLSIGAGQTTAILGLSGSGKTTLLNLLGGLDKPTSGRVFLNQQRFDHLSVNKRALMRNKSLGFIYQFHHLLPEFTALDNVMMPLMIDKKSQAHDNRNRAMKLLDAVGLSHRIMHKPAELSGGERQRVAIARALVCNPQCVLADEPTGNLDSHNAEKVLSLIESLSDTFSVSFVIVTHDQKLANRMDVIHEIVDGQLK